MGERRKKLKKPKAWDKQDRISNLPDVLLTHILSFVRTQDAVSTSVLSKRWKPLWAHVPALHLRDSEFSPYGDALVDSSKRKANFLTFVNRFLMRNNWSPVREFHLRCEECYDFSLIESWICAVKSPHLEELLLDIYTSLLPRDLHSKNRLHLSLSYKCLDTLLQQDTSLSTGKLRITGSYLEDPSILDSLFSLCKEWNIVKKLEFVGDTDFDRDETYNFSQKLFTWDMLVVLKLRNCIGIDCPKDSICFPNLKVLHLENNRFKYDDSASNLISSSCPVLEELDITRIEFDELLYLVITSLTLKFLKLYFWDSNRNLPFETVIDVPALEYLDLRDHLTKKIVLGEFGSIIEATVDVSTQCAAEILGKIHNVQKLLLYENAWGYGVTKTFGLPAFHYLTCLDFCTYDDPCDMEWRLILEFLSRSPTLEDLSFEGVEFTFGEELDLTLEQDVPHCLLSSLKNCQIYLCSRQVSYIQVIGYILKNSKVLEYMNIHHYRLYVNKQEISALSRGSSACEIYYYE